MRIIEPSYEIESLLNHQLLIDIERYGRTCYKSECREINVETAKKFVAMIIRRGHESVLEHGSITVRFVIDRGLSHEIVRHRIVSYSQESTRYCNYSGDKFGNEITVIDPHPIIEHGTMDWIAWEKACKASEVFYFEMLNLGNAPEMARDVLPNSLKTELVMTANPREWRHFFTLRTAQPYPAIGQKGAHPQLRQVVCPMLEEFRMLCPVLFDDVGTVDLGPKKPERLLEVVESTTAAIKAIEAAAKHPTQTLNELRTWLKKGCPL